MPFRLQPFPAAFACRVCLPALLLVPGLLAVPALATAATGQGEAPPPALTVEDCRRLLRQLPSGDANYVPGVSATGEAVAPADLPPSGDATLGGGTTAFDEVEIKLLSEPVPLGDTGVAAELRPGTLTVNTRTGQVLLNGRPLTGDDGTLARYCAALEQRRRN